MASNVPPTVLLVEDDEPLADLYADWLRDDYHVEVVHGGEPALERLAEGGIDVVLLDRHMPDVSGDEVLVTLRDWGLDARVAMVTGVSPEMDVLEMGFDDYLLKPVDRGTLVETVEGLLDRGTYEELRIELGSLRVKRNVLQVEQSERRLAEDDRYEALCARIERLEALVEEHRSQAGVPAAD
ncbi:response regulator [Haloglomus salinum]|jgi:two-component system response regulator AdeR|uniref:response regulator n=1 Tax=Haloglomus salinum TaxID=2962673 RepID=UPI0020C94424|nr:response regulator [Haloglomus salinum]